MPWYGRARPKKACGLVDETMAAVSAGQLSPIVAGIVYCNTIAFCRDVYELRRAQEWTTALTRWCEGAARDGRTQRALPRAQGRAHDHRGSMGCCARGAAPGRRALQAGRPEPTRPRPRGIPGRRESIVSRASFRDAETAYKEAARFGREPQPGLALLRLAQGKGEAAAATIRRGARRDQSCR